MNLEYEVGANLPEGEVILGAFAALNNVIEENGSWYFYGIYLYGDQPTEEQIEDKKIMFRLTYENMIDFIENSNADALFENLEKF